MTDAPDDATLRRWLLQQLPDADAQALEARLMHDDAFAARLADAETDLVDDAARGALDTADAEAFRRCRLADPATRERVLAARAFARLRDAAGQAAARPRLRRRHALGLAAAAALAAVAILWPARRTAPPPVASLPTIALLANTARGAEDAVRIATPATAVRLQVEVADTSRRYALDLESNGRRTLLARDLAPRESDGFAYVETQVAPALLLPGRHRLLLLAAPDNVERDWNLAVGD